MTTSIAHFARRFVLVGLLFLPFFLTSCTSLGGFRLFKEKIPVSGDKNPVVEVLAMWQPGDGPGPNGRTTRGFVGQLYFFTAKSDIAAKVTGSVEIYLFDDQGTEEDQIKPIHVVNYPIESLEKLGQAGKLGESYTVFVAYNRPGFHKAQCSLRVTYTPKNENQFIINSSMVNVTLPGREKKGSSESTDGTNIQLDNLQESPLNGDLDSVEQHNPLPAIGKRRRPNGQASNIPPSLARKLQSIDLSELQKPQRRPALAPLDEGEQQRIVREMRRKGFEFETEEESGRVVQASGTKQRRNRQVLQANYEEESVDDSDRNDNDWVEEDGDYTPQTRRKSARSRTVRQSHVVDLDDLE